MFIGIDLGTSSVKAVLIDDGERLLATESRPLAISRPRPGWSEQAPDDWWQATVAAIDALAAARPAEVAATRGIGLSGQMHGAVLLDRDDRPLRPAILWNDGRSATQCAAFEAAFPASRAVTGNLAMPGFTAPKLLWVREHEPDVFAALATVLLPKAFVRLKLTGERREEMSDASGTLWLDVAQRRWSDEALAASGLDRSQVPALSEGNAAAGMVLPALASRWRMPPSVVVAGGAGDNAASAIGLGAVAPGSAFLSLGTSGVFWLTTDGFRPDPEHAVHAFCHAVPATWHAMSVMLSAASSLTWLAALLGRPEAALLQEFDAVPLPHPAARDDLMFLPYLGGERTPHNAAALRAAFEGLSHDTDVAALVRAVLEGVSFGLRDGVDVLRALRTPFASALAVGGGARSRGWLAMLASVLAMPISRVDGAESAAATGAARLGQMAATGESPAAVCRLPRVVEVIEPDPAAVRAYEDRLTLFRERALRLVMDVMPDPATGARSGA